MQCSPMALNPSNQSEVAVDELMIGYRWNSVHNTTGFFIALTL